MVELADETQKGLLIKYGSLDKVPDKILTAAAKSVESKARDLVEQWTHTHGGKL